MRRSVFYSLIIITCLLMAPSAGASEFKITKHIIPAPAPIDEPAGVMTPDGTFNVRDSNAGFYSERLADAMWLDADGRNKNGDYLNLNHAIYTAYRLADDSRAPDTILVLMPGTWAGSMSMDRCARDVLRMADKAGRKGLQVWLHDRRSEQLEDHTGLVWAEKNRDTIPIDEIAMGVVDYYQPTFQPEVKGKELLGRRATALDHDAVRFIAGWGGDVALRDWRTVVLQAHRKVGNEVVGTDVDRATVIKKPGRRVFIGGHSLGGSLTVLYAAYDFDRRPGHQIWGMDDVAGLVLLEGGSANERKTKQISAKAYRSSLSSRYDGGKVFFDMDMLGIRYAPATMGSVSIAGWAATVAPERESVFPDYSRPPIVRLPRVTNAALLGYSLDDDLSPFFIARVSMGYPSGKLGLDGQLRIKAISVPADPGECPVLTPWKPGHRVKDRDYVYDWKNIDENAAHPAGSKPGRKKCRSDNPEVTDFFDFARSVYAGPHEYEEAPWLSSGPNDFPEWYFPPRLSSDSSMIGTVVMDEETGIELFNATGTGRLALPVISFVGNDSMGAFSVPKLNQDDFTLAALAHKQTQVHNILGYTHLDITSATRNFQPDLHGQEREYNAPAVYTYYFIESLD